MRNARTRRLDRALTGRADARDVRELVRALGDDATTRSAYDRGAQVMRALERRAVAEVEIDWVERRLEADGILGAPRAAPSPSRWWWIGAAALAAAVAVLVLPRAPAPEDDGAMTVRGSTDAHAGWLGLSVLCDGGRGPARALTEVSGGVCPRDGTLAFAVRVDARHRGAEHLVIFGVDEQGRVQYYVPTPERIAPTITRREVWISVDRAVRLRVNHPLGRVRVFAALLPHPPSIDAIDAAAAALAAGGDETPWLERLGPAHGLLADCELAECIGAELEFRIEAEEP